MQLLMNAGKMQQQIISSMKNIIVFGLLLAAFSVNAQTRDEKQVIERTQLLSRTVFGTKDSLTLDDLFAKTATYGHSGGKVQTREEAISGIYHNQSVYTDTSLSG